MDTQEMIFNGQYPSWFSSDSIEKILQKNPDHSLNVFLVIRSPVDNKYLVLQLNTRLP